MAVQKQPKNKQTNKGTIKACPRQFMMCFIFSSLVAQDQMRETCMQGQLKRGGGGHVVLQTCRGHSKGRKRFGGHCCKPVVLNYSLDSLSLFSSLQRNPFFLPVISRTPEKHGDTEWTRTVAESRFSFSLVSGTTRGELPLPPPPPTP